MAARALGASLEVINLGTAHDTGPLDGVKDCHLGPGTANFTLEPAMDVHQLGRALGVGRHAAERALLSGAQLFIGGEMGIGNTTAAAALACALLDAPPEGLAGPGTGLDTHGVARKTEVIRRALACHRTHHGPPLEALRRLGGFEIAALTGALHLDGLADSADAWVGGHGDRDKTLAIMKDPRSGPMAVVTLVLARISHHRSTAAA